jgi:hypothetical protein
MQNGVAAIRAVRSRTRFVLPPAHRRERQLGLHRVFRTPSPSSPTALAQARLQPVKALLHAARGLVPAAGMESRVPTTAAIGADPRMRWTRSRNGLSGSRIAGSSPWRD